MYRLYFQHPAELFAHLAGKVNVKADVLLALGECHGRRVEVNADYKRSLCDIAKLAERILLRREIDRTAAAEPLRAKLIYNALVGKLLERLVNVMIRRVAVSEADRVFLTAETLNNFIFSVAAAAAKAQNHSQRQRSADNSFFHRVLPPFNLMIREKC